MVLLPQGQGACVDVDEFQVEAEDYDVQVLNRSEEGPGPRVEIIVRKRNEPVYQLYRPSAEVTLAKPGSGTETRVLPDPSLCEVYSVKALGNKLLILGWLSNNCGQYLHVIDLATQMPLGTIDCFEPSISPSLTKAAYQSFRPRFVREEVMPPCVRVADLRSIPFAEHQVFPRGLEGNREKDGRVHVPTGGFLWSADEKRLVFFDQSMHLEEDLQSLEPTKWFLVTLDVTDLKNPSILHNAPIEPREFATPEVGECGFTPSNLAWVDDNTITGRPGCQPNCPGTFTMTLEGQKVDVGSAVRANDK
jgi:hypothetical protein